MSLRSRPEQHNTLRQSRWICYLRATVGAGLWLLLWSAAASAQPAALQMEDLSPSPTNEAVVSAGTTVTDPAEADSVRTPIADVLFPTGEEGPPIDEPITDDMVMDAADRLFLGGDMVGAAAAYKRALADFPDSTYLDQALFRLGTALDDIGKPQEAREYWERMLVTVPDSPYAPQVEERLLSIYRGSGQLDRALDILLGQLARAKEHDEKAALLQQTARVRLSLKDPERAIRDLIRRQKYLAQENREAGLFELRFMIDQQIAPKQLEGLVERFKKPIPAGWILERLIRFYGSQQDYYLTRQWGQRYLTLFADQPFADSVRQMLSQQREALRAHRVRVGVMLPTVGVLGRFGQQVLDGVRLAQRLAGLPDGSVGLWIEEPHPDRPEDTLRRLLRQADPAVVIGPLLSRQLPPLSEVWGRRAPLIAPAVALPDKAPDESIGLGVTPEDEGIAAARYAYRKLGLSRMIVLASEGPYGKRIVRGFSGELERLSGSVQETLYFDHQAKGIRRALEQLVRRDLRAEGIPKVTEKEVLALGPDEIELAGLQVDEPSEPEMQIGPPPEQTEELTLPLQGPPLLPRAYQPGFDGVFLAGPWQEVVLVAPHLPFNDITVPIVGTSGWYNPSLRLQGGDAVRGAHIVSPVQWEAHGGHTFSVRFQEDYGSQPDLFAALGFDAMNLALKGISTDPDDVWEGLLGPIDDDLTGIRSVDEDGRVARDWWVLKVLRRSFSLVGAVSTAPEIIPYGPPLPAGLPAEIISQPTDGGEAMPLDGASGRRDDRFFTDAPMPTLPDWVTTDAVPRPDEAAVDEVAGSVESESTDQPSSAPVPPATVTPPPDAPSETPPAAPAAPPKRPAYTPNPWL